MPKVVRLFVCLMYGFRRELCLHGYFTSRVILYACIYWRIIVKLDFFLFWQSFRTILLSNLSKNVQALVRGPCTYMTYAVIPKQTIFYYYLLYEKNIKGNRIHTSYSLFCTVVSCMQMLTLKHVQSLLLLNSNVL